MVLPKSCAILGHNPMRFAWGFDEEAAECHDMKMELAQQIKALRRLVLDLHHTPDGVPCKKVVFDTKL